MATKVPVKKRAPKTLKEKRFVKEYVANGGVGYKAALVAYDAKDMNSANQIARENLQKLTLVDLMEKRERLTDEMLLQDLENGLESFKVTSSLTEPDKVVPDFAVRHKWWTSAMDLKGHLKSVGDTNLIMPTPIIIGLNVHSDPGDAQDSGSQKED